MTSVVQTHPNHLEQINVWSSEMEELTSCQIVLAGIRKFVPWVEDRHVRGESLGGLGEIKLNERPPGITLFARHPQLYSQLQHEHLTHFFSSSVRQSLGFYRQFNTVTRP